MGALTLPPSGCVYVDTNTVIYTVEQVEPFRSLLDPLWAAVLSGRLSIVTSELTWLEALVKPMREGDAALEALYRSFLSVPQVRLLPATLSLWEQAARLRSRGLKTPDALHAATGLASGCELFLTNDAAFRRVPNLPVVVLNEMVAS